MRTTGRWWDVKRQQQPGVANDAVLVAPGKTYNTVTPQSVPDGGLQYAKNCDLSAASFRLDPRYRKVLDLTAEAYAGNMLAFGMKNSSGSAVEYLLWEFSETGGGATHGKWGVVDASGLSATVGTTTDTVPGTGLSESVHGIWQYDDTMFFASNRGLYWATVGTEATATGDPSTKVAPYTTKLKYSVNRVNATALPFNTTTAPTITDASHTWAAPIYSAGANPAKIVYKTGAGAIPDVDGGDLSLKFTWPSNNVLSYSECAYFIIKANSPTNLIIEASGGGTVFKFEVSADDVTYYEAPTEYVEEYVAGPNDYRYWIRADTTGVDVWRSGWKYLKVSFRASKISCPNNLRVLSIEDLKYGGATVDYRVETGREGQATFAYALKLASSGNLSPLSPILKVTEPVALIGESPYRTSQAGNSLRPAGASFTLNVSVTKPSDADKIVFFRKVGDDWVAVSEQSLSAGTATYSHTVNYNGDDADAQSAVANYDFMYSTIGRGADSTCGCSWKGSNVVFKDNGYAYASRVGTKFETIWDITNDQFALDVNDIGNPRTLQITHDGDWVIDCVPNDALYMFGRKGVYAMTGNTFATANYPQRVPGAMGVLGIWGADLFKAGAVYATTDSLYYVEVNPTFTGEVQQRVLDDLMKDNRGDWQWLLAEGTSTQYTNVVVWRQTIYAFLGNRYVRIDKWGNVTRGAWADSMSVRTAVASDAYGVFILTTARRIGMLGDFARDGGTSVDGATSGTLASWEVVSKRWTKWTRPSRAFTWVKQRTDLLETVAAPTVVITYTGEQQSPGTISFGDSGSYKVNQPFWPRYSAGEWFEVKLVGTNNAECPQATITYAEGSKMRTPWPNSQ